ncbi:helix-turn-helix domain-containing protein [Streptococcus hyovaginalis]|uniref:helix-turn-helix domain-containing protein n=1 Tax=Streptococcus hyovaginalis TaxID=149015 RepID=UPI003BF8682B
MKKMLYALYRGDEFIDIGTRYELAEMIGVAPQTISFYASPTYQKRTKNGYVAERVGYDGDEI